MGEATAFLTIGRNPVRVFGLDAQRRARRFAVKAKLHPVDASPSGGATIIADLGFAWDPSWLGHLRTRPALAVTLGGRPALVHVPDAAQLPAVNAAIEQGTPLPPGFVEQRVEHGASFYNHALRKREPAYLMPLNPTTAGAVEKASYDGAYKGVTDLLTLYLWRGLAFHLTRLAAFLRLTPNMVTTIGAALCVWTFFLWRDGRYWEGMAAGFVFMVLDTVDGKLARCTGTSSNWGNIFDHGVDLVHPPFWYWAWGTGLAAIGLPIALNTLWTVISVIMIGYVVQRAIEGAFIKSFGIHIHVWERIDSRFRLITARRNPNMVILVASLLGGRPDIGLIAVAWWTGLSCLFHLVRLLQAYAARRYGGRVVSWLA
ncbi:MAG: CDP-alcohol phosphatidyltransferase family protein [Sphingomonadaceae bacterium]|nr:CDP-alcohol phosphatidyltransferase family protein [Sphingomonadaceae bacterium]